MQAKVIARIGVRFTPMRMEIETPQSVNFDFMTRLHLSQISLYGSLRWVNWQDF